MSPVKQKIQKFREYLDYFERHYDNVQKAWALINEKCENKEFRFISDDFVWHSIDSAIKMHDESKLSVHEFTQYRRYFYPIDGEDQNQMAFNAVAVSGDDKIQDKPGDTEAMAELKKFCRDHNIADVFLRMLKVLELKKIQGFPDDYVLCGNQENQKKFIGNSVTPPVTKAWFKAMAERKNKELKVVA